MARLPLHRCSSPPPPRSSQAGAAGAQLAEAKDALAQEQAANRQTQQALTQAEAAVVGAEVAAEEWERKFRAAVAAQEGSGASAKAREDELRTRVCGAGGGGLGNSGGGGVLGEVSRGVAVKGWWWMGESGEGWKGMVKRRVGGGESVWWKWEEGRVCDESSGGSEVGHESVSQVLGGGECVVKWEEGRVCGESGEGSEVGHESVSQVLGGDSRENLLRRRARRRRGVTKCSASWRKGDEGPSGEKRGRTRSEGCS